MILSAPGAVSFDVFLVARSSLRVKGASVSAGVLQALVMVVRRAGRSLTCLEMMELGS